MNKNDRHRKVIPGHDRAIAEAVAVATKTALANERDRIIRELIAADAKSPYIGTRVAIDIVRGEDGEW